MRHEQPLQNPLGLANFTGPVACLDCFFSAIESLGCAALAVVVSAAGNMEDVVVCIAEVTSLWLRRLLLCFLVAAMRLLGLCLSQKEGTLSLLASQM